jgi:hypothetical protein
MCVLQSQNKNVNEYVLEELGKLQLCPVYDPKVKRNFFSDELKISRSLVVLRLVYFLIQSIQNVRLVREQTFLYKVNIDFLLVSFVLRIVNKRLQVFLQKRNLRNEMSRLCNFLSV